MTFTCYYCQAILFMNTDYDWIARNLTKLCADSPSGFHRVSKLVVDVETDGELL